jgi:nucleotide-binding universal stress UspA family protein
LQVFNDEAFAILVLMCLILMFFTTPAVMALYKPARTPVPYTNRKLEGSTMGKKDQLRVLVCVHGTGRSIPALVNFVEACRGNGSKRSSLKLFVMHLIELSDRASSIMALSRAAQREKPDGGGSDGGAEEGHHVEDDNLLVAFKTYGQISKVPVRCLTAVSELSTMHYDVCNAGAERRATVILLPYNSLYHREDGSIDHVNSGLRAFYQKVMHHAPCSVAMLVDRGSWGSETLSESSVSQKVAVFFLGGPDDREALTFGRRLVQHPNISLQVFRFLLPNRDHAQNHVRVSIADSDDDDDVKLDEESLAAAKTLGGVAGMAIHGPQVVSYEEKQVHGNMTEAVLATARAHDFSLILVGKSRKTSALDRQSESSELGALGEALANASSSEMKSSILVIQQHVTPTISYTNSKTPS